MALITPNTQDMADFSPIPEGTYKGRILEVTPETSEKGNPMIVVKMDIEVDGQKARRRTARIVTQGPGSFNFDQILRACRFDDLAEQYKDSAVQPKPPFDTDDLQGQELNVIIKPDTYNGQITDKVAGFLKL